MDFAAELEKLLSAEESPPIDPLVELVRAHAGALKDIHKGSSGISMQVEEIYDIVKESDENAKETKNAAKRESLLLNAFFIVNDLLDSLLFNPLLAGGVHTEALAAKREETLQACGIERIGCRGQMLDPRIHTVASAEESEAQRETVTRVLESGYLYRGNVARKATVIISKGAAGR